MPKKEADPIEEEFEEEIPEENVEEAINAPSSQHARSRGLFTDTWWKRGLMQGFFIWVIILGFAFFMDFLNLVSVEAQRNWLYLLGFLLLVFLIYQRFLKGKVII